MDRRQKRFLSGILLLAALPTAYAAKPIDLSHQPISALQSLIVQGAAPNGLGLKEFRRSVDSNKTAHIRVQQTYQGHDVFGADAVIHVPNAPKSHSLAASLPSARSMNGTIYQDLQADLGAAPKASQADKALQLVINNHQQKVGGSSAISEQQAKLIVYVDEANKAHWAYQISFYADAVKEGAAPSKPVAIVDAATLTVYVQWDNIQTASTDEPGKMYFFAGGFGGNKKMGQLTYDGSSDHLASLTVSREAKNCTLENGDVTVKRYRTNKVLSFKCKAPDAEHNNVYWDGELGAVNGGFSPGNDALFGGAVIKDMYAKWYGVPALVNSDGTPMMLNMIVHYPRYDNAYWDGSKMTFGDGASTFYPLTSLGVAAHEVSHGFTEQHSGLNYYGQSGGINEAFSDMAAQAAEFFAYGKNSWEIGPEIFKKEGAALRYMDMPSKDCDGGEPGNWCSIDDASQYYRGLDVHYSSGVFNRFFYLLGTSEGWDTRKAFDVMVNANANYWTSSVNFIKAACGVISAAEEKGYNTAAILKAFEVVKVDTSSCIISIPSKD